MGTCIAGPPVMRTASAALSAMRSARDRPSAGVPCSCLSASSITFRPRLSPAAEDRLGLLAAKD